MSVRRNKYFQCEADLVVCLRLKPLVSPGTAVLDVPVSEGGGNYSITTSRLGIIDSLIGEFSPATLSPAVSLDKRLAGFQLVAAAQAVELRTRRSHPARHRPGI